MFDELWLLADHYLKRGRMSDAYQADFMRAKRQTEPVWRYYGLKICFASKRVSDEDLSLIKRKQHVLPGK